MRIADVGEFGLIECIASLAAGSRKAAESQAGQIILGIGDDAALLEVPEERQLVATIDTLVEEVHFRRDWTGPEDLGWKSLAVNVSDVAAMGAEPLAAFLSLALPEGMEVEWVEAFIRGMDECAQEYGCRLAGGDTVRSPRHLTITVALLGTVERGRALLRSGARVGDAICVTGTLGDSAAGLALLEKGIGYRVSGIGSEPSLRTPSTEHRTPNTLPFAPLLAAHHRPRPCLAAARALAASGWVTAMMDLSDGLASDIRHLAARSGVGARIRRDALPVSAAARAAGTALGVDPAEWALHGGEDYELLFTVAPDALDRARELALLVGAPLTLIGEISAAGLALVEVDSNETPLEPVGFTHFNIHEALGNQAL